MKKSLFIMTALCLLLSGCSSSTASNETNNTLQANSNTTEATVAEEPKQNKLPTEDDFSYTEYKYETEWFTLYIVGITNNSESTASIDVNATAYSSDNTLLGAANDSISVIGAGETTYMHLYFDDVSDIDHINYKDGMQIVESDYYVPVLSSLDVQGNVNGNVVVFSITNNGDVAAQFVEVYCLFLDANNNVLAIDSTYLVDSNSEIAPGATQVGQLNYYQGSKDPDFDHVDWYVSGRGSK